MFNCKGWAEIQTLVLLALKLLYCYSGDLAAEGYGELEDTIAMSGEWVSVAYRELIDSMSGTVLGTVTHTRSPWIFSMITPI